MPTVAARQRSAAVWVHQKGVIVTGIYDKTKVINAWDAFLAGEIGEQLELDLKLPAEPVGRLTRLLPYVLVVQATPQGWVTPGRTRLARIMGVHPRSIPRAIKELRRMGVLSLSPGHAGHRGKATTYKVEMPHWLSAGTNEYGRAKVIHKPEKGDTPTCTHSEKGCTPECERVHTGVPPSSDKGIGGRGVRSPEREPERLADVLPIHQKEEEPPSSYELLDAGCDTHGWMNPPEPCGGCAAAKARKATDGQDWQRQRSRWEADQRLKRQQAEREADRQWWAERQGNA